MSWRLKLNFHSYVFVLTFLRLDHGRLAYVIMIIFLHVIMRGICDPMKKMRNNKKHVKVHSAMLFLEFK